MKASEVLKRYAAGQRNFQRVDLRRQSFEGEDLSNVDFSEANIRGTNFTKTNLENCQFCGVKAGQSKIYKFILIIAVWLISALPAFSSYWTGEIAVKLFSFPSLENTITGVSYFAIIIIFLITIHRADLTDASFIDSNLSEANLQDVNLSGAKLIQTQLDKTDFTGATLTGACIEDWGITTYTKLDQVKCKYIFMRSPSTDNPNPRRKPDNWEEEFTGNDFAEFIQPIFDTLDLYHNQGIDPRAIAISWKELAEKNPDAQLKFASMEVKGDDSLLLRLKAEPHADLSRLNAEYFTNYNQIKALTEVESQKLIAEKDDRIKALENMLNTALEHPKTLVNQNGNFGIGNMNDGEIKENAQVLGIANQKKLQDNQ